MISTEFIIIRFGTSLILVSTPLSNKSYTHFTVSRAALSE